MNLTAETIDGILNHSYQCMPNTLEGQVVRLADKIAYINHDIQDAIRARIIKQDDIPKESIEYFSTTNKPPQEVTNNNNNKRRYFILLQPPIHPVF